MSLHQPSVYIVVLNWRDYRCTKQCLESLQKITYANYEIIVVDNASGDGSLEKLVSEFPNVSFISNPTNLGFSCGVNPGIKSAHESEADYILVLNNDMIVPPSFLEPAIEVAESNPNVGAVTGRIMFESSPDMFWHAGGHIDMFRVQGVARGLGARDQGQYDTIAETGWASGAMSLIPKKTIELVGYYPEEHFFGQEEWDYSLAILKAGLKILYVPAFTGLHEVGGSYNAGHPILNVYGGYLSKMIIAEKYMPNAVWHCWKFLFWLYLRTRWPRIAWEGCKCEEDYRVRLGAGYLAYADHKRIKSVKLKHLKEAAAKLGPAPSWGDEWASEK